MQIQVDFRSGVPIYLQIMDQIKHLIASGALQPGDQLPTVRQLAADLRVNFNTVARTYRLLDEAGIISTQHGRGTFILAAPEAEAAERLRRQALLGLTRNYLAQAHRLGFSLEEVIADLERQIEHWKNGALPDEAPWKPNET
jgi:GntR family transcriptional regulator